MSFFNNRAISFSAFTDVIQPYKLVSAATSLVVFQDGKVHMPNPLSKPMAASKMFHEESSDLNHSCSFALTHMAYQMNTVKRNRALIP
jgi:hypothetical protein